MNDATLSDFEEWAVQFGDGYDLEKTSAMRTENPYTASSTWKAYESWCASAAPTGLGCSEG